VLEFCTEYRLVACYQTQVRYPNHLRIRLFIYNRNPCYPFLMLILRESFLYFFDQNLVYT